MYVYLLLCDVMNDNTMYIEEKWNERQWDVKRHAIRVKKISFAQITVRDVSPSYYKNYLLYLDVLLTLHFKTLFHVHEVVSWPIGGLVNLHCIGQQRKSQQCGFLINYYSLNMLID